MVELWTPLYWNNYKKLEENILFCFPWFKEKNTKKDIVDKDGRIRKIKKPDV